MEGTEKDEIPVIFDDHVNKVANEAIYWYGYINQCNKAIEEAGEFTEAITELKSHITPLMRKVDEKYIEPAIDETADILFTAFQVAKILGLEKVKSRLDYKANRLSQRIDADIKKRNEYEKRATVSNSDD